MEVEIKLNTCFCVYTTMYTYIHAEVHVCGFVMSMRGCVSAHEHTYTSVCVGVCVYVPLGISNLNVPHRPPFLPLEDSNGVGEPG